MSGAEQRPNKARYDFYRLYRIHLETDEHVAVLQQLENECDTITFYGHARNPQQKLTVMVAASKIAEIEDIMQRFGIGSELLEINMQQQIDNEENFVKAIDTPAIDFGWENYYHLSTIYAWLDHLAEKYSFISVLTIGTSYNGVPIKGVKLSRKTGNTAVFVEGGIHSREWISPATVTFLLNQLIHSQDSNVVDISENFDWFLFPTINPDGYKYTFEKDRLWRKNRQPYGIFRGVDLNRNFDSNWSGNGASTDPKSYDFAGGSAESEPEAKVVADFIRENCKTADIRTYIALHSYSQLLMFPYGHTPEHVSDYSNLKAICDKAVSAIASTHGKVYGSGSKYETIYPSSGGSIDWAYKATNIPISLTFELRGPPDSTNMFILPANEIIQTGEETLAAFVAIMQEARQRGYYNKA